MATRDSDQRRTGKAFARPCDCDEAVSPLLFHFRALLPGFDALEAGQYVFGKPNQIDVVELLTLCGMDGHQGYGVRSDGRSFDRSANS